MRWSPAGAHRELQVRAAVAEVDSSKPSLPLRLASTSFPLPHAILGVIRDSISIFVYSTAEPVNWLCRSLSLTQKGRAATIMNMTETEEPSK